MACIPGGPFVRGRNAGPNVPTNETPAATVWVQTFWMDRTEVTNAAYRACVAAGGCERAGPRYTDFDGAEQPITGVSWHHAVAYCAWSGKRLPTEAEWEKAARGPDGEPYPWGDSPVDCEHAVIKDARGRSCGVPKAQSKPEVGKVLPVPARPAYRYGLHDMIGNSWEWVADAATPSWEACGAACEGTDPKGPCGGAEPCAGHRQRVLRGGSWYWDASHATSTRRRAHFPANEPFHHFGFRCADDVDPS
jgi:formylglycine-generating enzyme required for sulfatase activity